MIQIRISRPEDIPRQRELWQLAFGDDGAYVDNFYNAYYQPERVLLLEEDGVVQAMTAWFETTFAVPGQGRYRAAYLYAVATHPEARGRGLAGQLLAGADRIFREWDIPAVTTVPAEPSLHRFFGWNGFRECFVDGQFSAPREGHGIRTVSAVLKRLTPEEYRDLREGLLAGTAHIDLPQEALAPRTGRPLRRGDGMWWAAGEGAAVPAGGSGLGAGTPPRPAAPVVLCLAHPRGLPPLRDAQVAGPGAGAVLGLGLHRLFGARI